MIQCHRHRRRRVVVVPVTTSLILLLLSLLTIGGLPRHDVHAASAAAAVNNNNNEDELLLSNIKCSSGWTASAAASSLSSTTENAIPHYIPTSWINDGYCDCPFGNENGMTDEPNTNACSGSKSWPGVKGSIISTSIRYFYYCVVRSGLYLYCMKLN
ncbi:hypothetical protein FRACYDRAFT_255461 [Fragilariopsis cylindrus CCMP1102]|uniref:Glucosidase II beta subunit N-terminal domain-containing protein n=1 Tax=Fragilariopsis cylindrus CCMP1102 TaxID=635003 RepID=A0A1E7EK49_9STRA|nr:hypothetical protein FRACYDRAFT_255461 [Fragilariopsis cylindrus CCMP1102]|eukprot:OEU06247.1 hypothetical protein FRACYDRAFT_255461 [Fragilariopsis cylindrus CCMP1102]